MVECFLKRHKYRGLLSRGSLRDAIECGFLSV
jgi:hypothetical protein